MRAKTCAGACVRTCTECRYSASLMLFPAVLRAPTHASHTVGGGGGRRVRGRRRREEEEEEKGRAKQKRAHAYIKDQQPWFPHQECRS
eukprot:3940927-Rhodomonas_salina.10